jgi:hypothetical protein
MTAYLLSTFTRSDHDINERDLLDLEKGITDRIFRLIESVMQMGVTQQCPCYNPSAINQRIAPVLELAQVIAKQPQ